MPSSLSLSLSIGQSIKVCQSRHDNRPQLIAATLFQARIHQSHSFLNCYSHSFYLNKRKSSAIPECWPENKFRSTKSIKSLLPKTSLYHKPLDKRRFSPALAMEISLHRSTRITIILYHWNSETDWHEVHAVSMAEKRRCDFSLFISGAVGRTSAIASHVRRCVDAQFFVSASGRRAESSAATQY